MNPASICQLILFSIGFVLAIVEIAMCTRALIILSSDYYWYYWLFGGIAHGLVMVMYYIAFFCMYRSNKGFVKTKADLIITGLLMIVAAPCGWFFSVIAFGQIAPLLVNFIVEWIYVGTRRVKGKWSRSLYNVNIPPPIVGAYGSSHYASSTGVGYQGGTPYAKVSSANSYTMHPQPYQPVANPGHVPAYQYATPYQTQQGHWH